MMVEKPDVYICNNCGHRFQKAKFVNIQDEDGIYISKAGCPECDSTDLVLSSWLLKEKSPKE